MGVPQMAEDHDIKSSGASSEAASGMNGGQPLEAEGQSRPKSTGQGAQENAPGAETEQGPKTADGPEEGAGKESQETEGKEKKVHKHWIKTTWLRRTLKTLMWVIIALIVLPFTIYIPPVQKLLVNVACSYMKKSTGMDVSIERFRLAFPLDVKLEKLLVVDEHRDTMVRAESLLADVRLLPLLKGDVDIKKLELRDGYYRMLSKDSSMLLTVDAGYLKVDGGSTMNLKTSAIDLINPVMRNGHVNIAYDVWKVKPDTVSEPSTMVIRSANVKLENVTYSMQMLPYFTNLSTTFKDATVKNLVVDTKNAIVSAESVISDGGDVLYTSTTAAYAKAHPVPVDTIPAKGPPQQVKIGTIDLRDFHVIYNVDRVVPKPGFNLDYIEMNHTDLTVKDFYNCLSVVKVPITSLKGNERSGINFRSGSGLVDIDSLAVAVRDIAVRTDYSDLNVDAYLSYEMMDFKPDGKVSAKIGGYIGKEDIILFMPESKSYVSMIPFTDVGVDVDVSGTLGALDIKNFGLDFPGLLHFHTGGYVENLLDFDKMKLQLDLQGALEDALPVNKYLKKLGVIIPQFTIGGNIGYDNDVYSADLALKSPDGNIVADGNVNLTAERYDIDVELNHLDVKKLMPKLDVGVIDGKLYATGAGFNPMHPSTKAHVEADIRRADYGGYSYGPLTLDADLDKEVYEIALASTNRNMDLDLNARGSMHKGTYDIDARAQIHHLDLKAIGLMDSTCYGSGWIEVNGTANPTDMLFDINLAVRDFDWTYSTEHISLPYAADMHFLATTDSTAINLNATDLALKFEAPEALMTLFGDFMMAGSDISSAISAKNLDVAMIQAELPKFTLDAQVGGDGVVHQFVESTGYQFDSITLNLSNADILSAEVKVKDFDTGSMLLNNIGATFTQKDDRLNYRVNITNQPPNLPEFADVSLFGYLMGNRASLAMRQINDKGEEGYRLGLTASYADSVLALHFTPLNAIIAYKPWTINDDNYVEIGPGKMIRSSLTAEGMGSSISLQSGLTDKNDNYVDVVIKDLHLQDFLQMMATAPPVTGDLNTNLHLELHEKGLTGQGNLLVNELYYDRMRIGNLGVDFQAGSNLKNTTAARVDFSLDRQKIMSIHGYASADTTGHGAGTTKLTLDLDTFPLRILNPFIGNDVVKLEGALNGSLDIAGTVTSPVLNGDIYTRGVKVYVPMAASYLRINDGEAISVVDNLLKLNNVQIFGANDNPLTLSGSVDARKFSDILLDVGLKGNNVMLLNNDKRALSDIYGKLAINLDASVKGSMQRMDINAALSVLSSTNVTYVLGADPAAIETSTTTDVVKFVQFNDTTQMLAADSVARPMQMAIEASLNISNGAQLTVNLNRSGTNRARINPNGQLNYTQSYLGDSHLFGQLNIPSGQVRYTPPLMTEKVFDFLPESYVSWTGPMMNPTLHLYARDHMKANVQQQGTNSRLIYFDIDLSVLGTLTAPKIAFDLSTEDDITVHNELLSMTPSQRSNEAMNLLLYNTYTGPGVTATSNLTGNPLYSFLTGQLNAWAARAIRGVDVSFGIDQYKDTYNGQSSTATSYSYQVSKSLFDNRFKIVVGGNYTANANTDENFVENLISDISFEYMLKQTNTMSMYVRLFRHTGWESILEGEITETGVGFVMKRKISNLRQLFRFGNRKKRSAQVTTDSITTDTTRKEPDEQPKQ